MERFDELKQMVSEKTEAVVEDHPVAVGTGLGVLALVAALPLCWLAYRFVGKTAGKAAAKELKDAGVWLGYTHP